MNQFNNGANKWTMRRHTKTYLFGLTYRLSPLVLFNKQRKKVEQAYRSKTKKRYTSNVSCTPLTFDYFLVCTTFVHKK